MNTSSEHYDVIVVGAGIAGASLAATLGKQGKRVLVIERDLTPPDTFRGELLQPGGVKKIKELGLSSCLEGIDGHACYGYVVYESFAKRHIPLDFPKPVDEDGEEITGKKTQGISFHHGRFVGKLRDHLKTVKSVTVIEANVLDFIEDGEELLGITFKRKDAEVAETAHASLTVDCSGSFSKLRRKLTISQATYKSHFVALLLKDCVLPYPNYGYVTLAKPAPVLCYQIATNEVRMLVAVPDPLPSVSKGELKNFLLNTVRPQLPEFFHAPFAVATEEQLRSVPCRTMPTMAVRRPGGFCLGDSLNMRHPLTGGGMTVAFTDVSIIAQLLQPFDDLSDKREIMDALEPFYQIRRHPAGTINTLSQALYAVFCGASADPALAPMTDGCFAYFPHYGSETLGILGGMYPSPYYLVMHFFAVAFYTMWQLMKPYPTPQKFSQAFGVLYAAFFVIKPLLTENFFIKPARRFGEVKMLSE